VNGCAFYNIMNRKIRKKKQKYIELLMGIGFTPHEFGIKSCLPHIKFDMRVRTDSSVHKNLNASRYTFFKLWSYAFFMNYEGDSPQNYHNN